MIKYSVTNIRHTSMTESHATVRIDNREYPCVATARAVDASSGAYRWFVQHHASTGETLEVCEPRLRDAWNAMAEFIIDHTN